MNRSDETMMEGYRSTRLGTLLPGTANVHARLRCLGWEWSKRPERGTVFLEPPTPDRPMVFIFSNDREIGKIEFGYWEVSDTPPYGQVSTDPITPPEAMALLDEWEAELPTDNDRPSSRMMSRWET